MKGMDAMNGMKNAMNGMMDETNGMDEIGGQDEDEVLKVDETSWINGIDEECWDHQREERELERERERGLELEHGREGEREGEREYAGKLGRVSTRLAIVETTRFVCIVWIAWTA